jgi:hypothetical protein
MTAPQLHQQDRAVLGLRPTTFITLLSFAGFGIEFSMQILPACVDKLDLYGIIRIGMVKLCEVNLAAREKLPPTFAEKSGIGSHYVDAFVKPMNTKLPDGTRVGCKRKGLKIMLTVGTKKGEGLMRRLEVSKDPVVMLQAALQEAAKAAGVRLEMINGGIFIAA